MSCRTCGPTPNQRGGGASDFRHSANAVVMDPRALSDLTLRNIDRSPMFNPLQPNTVIPTGVSGIVPEGVYYMNAQQLNCMAKKHGINRFKRNEMGQMVPFSQNELIEKIKGKGVKFYC